jgi:flagellin FlaB
VIPGGTPGGTDSPELPDIKSDDPFTIEVKPDVGARLPINRVAPPNLKKEHKYEVY